MLGRLVDQGNTVLVIEHNLDVIKTADWIVDMGPEGGSRGGLVVAEGTPEDVAANPDSFTGEFLKPLLDGREAKQPTRKKPAAQGAGRQGTGPQEGHEDGHKKTAGEDHSEGGTARKCRPEPFGRLGSFMRQVSSGSQRFLMLAAVDRR